MYPNELIFAARDINFYLKNLIMKIKMHIMKRKKYKPQYKRESVLRNYSKLQGKQHSINSFNLERKMLWCKTVSRDEDTLWKSIQKDLEEIGDKYKSLMDDIPIFVTLASLEMIKFTNQLRLMEKFVRGMSKSLRENVNKLKTRMDIIKLLEIILNNSYNLKRVLLKLVKIKEMLEESIIKVKAKHKNTF